MPGAEWQKAATFGIEFEKKALLGSPDRVGLGNEDISAHAPPWLLF